MVKGHLGIRTAVPKEAPRRKKISKGDEVEDGPSQTVSDLQNLPPRSPGVSGCVS